MNDLETRYKAAVQDLAEAHRQQKEGRAYVEELLREIEKLKREKSVILSCLTEYDRWVEARPWVVKLDLDRLVAQTNPRPFVETTE
jgi:chromosome segregation ATPase